MARHIREVQEVTHKDSLAWIILPQPIAEHTVKFYVVMWSLLITNKDNQLILSEYRLRLLWGHVVIGNPSPK